MDASNYLDDKPSSYTYDELLDLTFKLVLPSSYYQYDDSTKSYKDMSSSDAYVKTLIDNGIELKISGIIVASKDAVATSIMGSIAYTSDLVDYVINETSKQEIVKNQLNAPSVDVFSSLPFAVEQLKLTIDDVMAYIASLPADQQQMIQGYIKDMTEEMIIEMFQTKIQEVSSATYEGNLEKLGYADKKVPSKINIYAKDFESKDKISEIIEEYNDKVTAEGKESLAISYTDYIGLMMSSISTVINAISYVLIAFVSISLVVSSIMIGIITYISVLERTKEIGILRSIGASKQDISRVFNAETMIVGLISGGLGIGITMLLNIPINIVLKNITNLSIRSTLPIQGAVVLVAISVLLTLIAGLIPSRVASKKDPVEALRSE